MAEEYQSNLVEHDLTDLGCPLSVSYRLTHGPSGGTAGGTWKIERDPPNAAANYMKSSPIGATCHIRADNSDFYGYIVGVEETASDSSGEEMLVVSMVDWRDRLSDVLFFAAFNMLEESGYCWHMLPEDWSSQDVTVVTRELEVIDFTEAQIIAPGHQKLKAEARETLISSATLLNNVADLGSFTWQFKNPGILTLLKKTRPMNLDWRDGATYAEVIEDILSKSNMQWTVTGPVTIMITQVGCDCNPDVKDFLSFNAGSWGSNMCEKLDGWESSRGLQLDESGTLIRIVGGRDKYQLTYPCKPDWNVMFDFQLCFDTYTLQLILKKHGLFMTSKLSELPEDYHDDTPIESPTILGEPNDRKTRNDMTIEEYVDDICFKTYMVDSENASRQFIINAPKFEAIGTYEPFWNSTVHFPEPDPPEPEDPPPDPPPDPDVPLKDETPLIDYDWEGRADRYDMAFHWPISPALVTESAHRMIVHRTAYILSKKETSPLEEQHYLSPGNQGATLDVDDIISVIDSKMIHVVRLKFSEPVFYIDDKEDFESLDKVKPDRILVTLSFDWKIYQGLYGPDFAGGAVEGAFAGIGGFRTREKKHSIAKLHRAYVDGDEVYVMAQSVRTRINAKGQVPALDPVLAKDIAENVAANLLNTPNRKKSGSMTRRHMAEFNVDGLITSVNVSFDGTSSGLTETLAFGGTQNFITHNAIPPTVYRVSEIIPTTSKVQRERIEEQADIVLSEAMALPPSVSTRKSLAGALKAATNIRFFSEFWRGINDPTNASIEFNIKPVDPDFKGSLKGGVVIVEEAPEDPPPE